MPVNREKAMTDAIDAIMRLDWSQLVLLNAHVSEHMFNLWQVACQRKDELKAHERGALKRIDPH